jgi:hypothetical protein
MTEFIPFSDQARSVAAERFVAWLSDTVINKAKGADRAASHDRPSDRIWLSRVAPISVAAASGRDDRLERMEPCAIGFRIQPRHSPPWTVRCSASFVLWQRDAARSWRKTDPVRVYFDTTIDPSTGPLSLGKERFAEAFATVGAHALSAEIQASIETGEEDEKALMLTLVNMSEPDAADDPRFYEAQFAITGLDAEPFLLRALEDSFRHDRRVPAYGINCGVER